MDVVEDSRHQEPSYHITPVTIVLLRKIRVEKDPPSAPKESKAPAIGHETTAVLEKPLEEVNSMPLINNIEYLDIRCAFWDHHLVRTTLDIDDPTLRNLKQLKKKEGKSMGRLVSGFPAHALKKDAASAAAPPPVRQE